jgi:hypothetical protein
MVVGCGGGSAPPTAIPKPAATATVAAPTPTFRPAVPPTPDPAVAPTPAATLDPAIDQNEVEVAFLSQIDDIIAEATDLAVIPCEDMQVVTTRNPSLVPSLRGFAATVKRVSSTQAALDTDAVKSALADLDQTMAQLEGALSMCGITQR